MEKKLLLIIYAVFITIIANAQVSYDEVLPVKNKKVTYTEVVKIGDASKDDLHKRARRWSAINCEKIKIDYKYEIVCEGVAKEDLWFTLIIELKDGKYRFTFSDFRIVESPTISNKTFYRNIALEDYKAIIGKETTYKTWDDNIQMIINSLKESMKTPIDKDW